MSNPSKIKRLRLGFTLVEMTVVMSIISIMMLLGASALMGARDQYIVDQVVEDFITQVRGAQNRSISIQKDKLGNATKAWGASITSNRLNMWSVYPRPDVPGSFVSRSDSFINHPPGISVNPSVTAVYYASPFGTPYLLSGVYTCSWIDSGKHTQEIKPNNTCSLSSTNRVITISYKGHDRTVVIQPNGDIYAQ